LKGNPKLSLKIIGQTDAIGDPVSNVELATSRARSARNYLINRGVRTDRMLIKVFGEAEAELPNKDENGNDLPENRKWNRRVVLALIDPNGE
jgi:outer membrane protein OmpA-like peptidoglycan-associated protein